MFQIPERGNSAPSTALKPFDTWFTPWRFGIFLALAIVCAFPKVMLGLHTFFYRDFGVLAYPMVHYHRECFWRGELPLWNPLSNCGAPFLAQWGTMTLYPFSLFYLVLPLPWSLNVFCLAHLFWAGLGMYFLTRRWVENQFAAGLAGTAFVFNGITFSCLIWPNYTVALGWMPWVILSVERAWREGGRRTIAAALIATMQMLAGVPEIVLITWLLLLGIWIDSFWRGATPLTLRIYRAVGIVLLICGLSAAQLWPFFDLLGHSQRSAEFATAKWSMPVWGWANLLVPLFRCFLTPQGIFFQFGQEFMSSTYLGVTTLLLTLYSVCLVRERRVGMLAFLGIFGLWMALGENGFLYRWVKQAVPLLGFARYPIKFVVVAAFVSPLLSAFAVRTLSSLPPNYRESRWRILFLLSLAMGIAIGIILEFTWRYPTHYDQWTAVLWCGIWRSIFLGATVALLCLRASVSRAAWRHATELGLLACVILDALTHVPKQNPTLPSYALEPGLWELHNKTPPPRYGQGRVMISPHAEQHLLLSGVPDLYSDWLGKRLALWSNLNVLEGAPKVNGSSTLQIREQMEVQSLLYATTNTDWPRLADFLAVTHTTAPGQIIEWTRRETSLPFVTGGQRPNFADATETLRSLRKPNFSAAEVVYLPRDAQRSITATNRTQVRISSQNYSSHKIEFDVSAEQPSLVVIAQTFYPAWRAYVDEHPTTVWRANHAFQAVQVSAGNHRVRLSYEDSAFKCGAAVSGTSLLLCVVFWILGRGRSKSS